jgi:hypothetical protein
LGFAFLLLAMERVDIQSAGEKGCRNSAGVFWGLSGVSLDESVEAVFYPVW